MKEENCISTISCHSCSQVKKCYMEVNEMKELNVFAPKYTKKAKERKEEKRVIESSVRNNLVTGTYFFMLVIMPKF